MRQQGKPRLSERPGKDRYASAAARRVRPATRPGTGTGTGSVSAPQRGRKRGMEKRRGRKEVRWALQFPRRLRRRDCPLTARSQGPV
ncbi:hypothetical protein SKAU_G00160050 [Synaphobranchus kaupii]|uniref:Uncharacterized protein n=1 Tax=Synaphobranchus kaupii TaxID=118154 RepID=A0A9Q1FIW9_SYNKA|nr:hypothetical protein SKAU_G00160050 [Synaphobranchus kaupii]